MKKLRFYYLYLALVMAQTGVLVFSLDITLFDWQYWAVLLTTIFAAMMLVEAYTR